MTKKNYPTNSQEAIVRIFSADGAYFGTGVLTISSLVVTCAHVVCMAVGQNKEREATPELKGRIKIDFPFLPDSSASFNSEQALDVDLADGGWGPADGWKPDNDIAVLKILDTPPFEDGYQFRSNRADAPIETSIYGFTREDLTGTEVVGTLKPMLNPLGLQVLDTKVSAFAASHGFSGGAIFPTNLNYGVLNAQGILIGNNDKHPLLKDGQDKRIVYIIPAERIAKLISKIQYGQPQKSRHDTDREEKKTKLEETKQTEGNTERTTIAWPCGEKNIKRNKMPIGVLLVGLFFLVSLFFPAPSGFSYKSCLNCPTMIIIPSGELLMGSPDGEAGAKTHEKPRHRVSINSYSVGITEVSNYDWDTCVKEGGCSRRNYRDKDFSGPQQPVVGVTWSNIKSYIRWMRKKTGKNYRLLSEAEWEYMARGGQSTSFWVGNKIEPEQANYDTRFSYNGSRITSEKDLRNKTLAVDSFPPNPYGVFNVHGNVRERVEDCWHENYFGAPDTNKAWLADNGGKCSIRVVRGGSFLDRPGLYLRSASRDQYPIGDDDKNERTGFRIAAPHPKVWEVLLYYVLKVAHQE